MNRKLFLALVAIAIATVGYLVAIGAPGFILDHPRAYGAAFGAALGFLVVAVLVTVPTRWVASRIGVDPFWTSVLLAGVLALLVISGAQMT